MGKNKFTGKEEYVEYEDGTRVLLAEDDSPPFTDKEWKRAKRVKSSDVLPAAFLKALEEGRVGRPKATEPRKPITLRVSKRVETAYRLTGKGWHTLMNKALEEYARSHDML